MATLERPRLRPLSGRRCDHQGQPYVALEDPLGVISGPVLIPIDGFQRVVRHFDGETTLDQIQDRVLQETGHRLPVGELEALVDRLDRAMVLEGPTFTSFREAYARADVRPAIFAGRSYAASATALRAELNRCFDHPNGSGLPSSADPVSAKSLRGILSPHIDFGRGGSVYSWAYRELVERSDADTFVILGVAHQYCRNRFILTRKHFETPLGTATTDRSYVDRLAKEAGSHLFEDELVHKTEHSLEFQVIFLQHVLGNRRDLSIVPILVGSFHDLMVQGIDPIDDPEVRRMVEALRSAELASGKKVAYIGGVDFCHVGPEFGDPNPVNDATLDQIRSFDKTMLDRASAGDASGWFAQASAIQNRWRVCGLAATYTMLQVLGPAKGRVLRYDQAVNPSRTCCVTFASVAYEAEAKASAHLA